MGKDFKQFGVYDISFFSFKLKGFIFFQLNQRLLCSIHLFDMNTTEENLMLKHFVTTHQNIVNNISSRLTVGTFNASGNSMTATNNTSENGTRAVSENTPNIPFLFFTLGAFQSYPAQIMVVIMLVIGNLGLVGNFCTILKIWRNKKFHTSTFVSIGCLAFADFLSIMNCYVFYFTNILSAVCVTHGVPSAVISLIVSELSYLSSLGHMMLLFLIRYLVTVNPLQSRSHLTSLVVILWSVTVWIVSLILSVSEASYGIVTLLSSQRKNEKQLMIFL
jgi:hypothetical protein